MVQERTCRNESETRYGPSTWLIHAFETHCTSSFPPRISPSPHPSRQLAPLFHANRLILIMCHAITSRVHSDTSELFSRSRRRLLHFSPAVYDELTFFHAAGLLRFTEQSSPNAKWVVHWISSDMQDIRLSWLLWARTQWMEALASCYLHLNQCSGSARPIEAFFLKSLKIRSRIIWEGINTNTLLENNR